MNRLHVNEEQELLLDLAAFRLMITDPSGIHEKMRAALEAVCESSEMSTETLAVLNRVTQTQIDIENGYRTRIGLEPKPYPWEGLP